MKHACFNCGHPAASHEPWCDETLETTYGPEECGCTTYVRDSDE
jgi:hypothetical protein